MEAQFHILGKFISETGHSPLFHVIICGVCILVRAVSGSEGVESLEGVDTEVILQVRQRRFQYLLKNLHLPFLSKKGERCKRLLKCC